MSSILNQSLDHFLTTLASKDPAPSGGSVAGLAASMAAGLVSMVCNVSIGKASEAHIEPLEKLLARSEALRKQASSMIDQDIAAFNQLMDAYRLPRHDDDDKKIRLNVIQNALIVATKVPFECAKCCIEILNCCEEAIDYSDIGILSDVGVGAAQAYSAIASCALTVAINVPHLKDLELAKFIEQETNTLKNVSTAQYNSIYNTVVSRLSS